MPAMTELGPVTWPPAPLRTERLVLRESEARDRAAVIELLASPEVGGQRGTVLRLPPGRPSSATAVRRTCQTDRSQMYGGPPWLSFRRLSPRSHRYQWRTLNRCAMSSGHDQQRRRNCHLVALHLAVVTAAPDQGMAKSGTGVTSSCLLGSVVVLVVLQERCDTGRERVGSADLAKLG